MMPCLLGISQDMEREGEHEQRRSRHQLGRLADSVSAAHIFFGENTFVIENGGNMVAWFSRLYLHHAKFIRKIVLGTWNPHYCNLQFTTQDFDRLQSLFRLESLTITLDEKSALRSCRTSCQPRIAWHGSLASGPQISLQILRVHGMTGLRSLRNIRVFEIKHSDHKEQKLGLKFGSFHTKITPRPEKAPHPIATA
jgi:hypothetical protein